jgi:hypothetical protein
LISRSIVPGVLPLDDLRYVKIDLDFDSVREAEAFRAALQDLWSSGRAALSTNAP